MIKALFAVDSRNGLGKNGSLPWPRDKEDMNRFRTLTTGHVVVMGSRSWDDPNMRRPLPNRINVVLTSKHGGNDWADIVAHGVDDVVALERKFTNKTIWMCGGANVLAQFRGKVEEVYLTRFDGDYGCDTFVDLEPYLKGFEEVCREDGTAKTFSIWR